MKRILFVAAFLGMSMLNTTANAQSCVIKFNDSFGLSLLDSSQAYGFMAPGGGLVWYYNQCGGSGSDNWLYFDEKPTTAYQHFHIPFLDPKVNCFTVNNAYPGGVSGRQATPSSPCVAVDPLHEPRYLVPHQPDEQLRIRYIANPGDPQRYILVTHIQVMGSTPVTVLVQEAGGGWWQWTHLQAGNWSLSNAMPATQAFVLASSTQIAPEIQVTNIGVTLGAYYTPPINMCLPCILTFGNAEVRNMLTVATASQSQRTSSAEATLDNAQPGTPTPHATHISAEEARILLNRAPAVPVVEPDKGLAELLTDVQASTGVERQLAIADYMQQVKLLPADTQTAATSRLAALFEPK